LSNPAEQRGLGRPRLLGTVLLEGKLIGTLID
jgi:hypothetical protein